MALAGWLSWLEHLPVHKKVVGLTPGQGTYLGWRLDPQSGRVPEASDQMFLSYTNVSFCLTLLFSLSPKINENISSSEDLKTKEINKQIKHTAFQRRSENLSVRS